MLIIGAGLYERGEIKLGLVGLRLSLESLVWNFQTAVGFYAVIFNLSLTSPSSKILFNGFQISFKIFYSMFE